jgi:hypothetical protein
MAKINKDKVDIEKLNAGLLILIQQVDEKPWDSEITDCLSKLSTLVNNLVYTAPHSQLTSSMKVLDSSEIRAVESIFFAFIRIIRSSRDKGFARLNFSSQRQLGRLISKIVYSPYIEFSTDGINGYDTIPIVREIYELARWQNSENSVPGDVIAEGEWINNIFGLITPKKTLNDYSKLASLLKLWLDLLAMAAQLKPERIPKLYANLSETLNSHCLKDIHCNPKKEENRWLLNFNDEINSIPRTFDSLNNIQQMLGSLDDDEIYKAYSHDLEGKQECLTKSELGNIKRDDLFNDVFAYTLLGETKKLSWQVSAYLIFYNRLEEYVQCVNWRQPLGGNVNWIGDEIFPKDIQELCNLMEQEYTKIDSSNWFVDRHNIFPYVIKGWLFHLTWFIYKDHNFMGQLPIRISGNLEQTKIQLKLVSNLLKNVEFIKNKSVVECFVVSYHKDNRTYIRLIQSLEATEKNLNLKLKQLNELIIASYKTITFTINEKIQLLDLFNNAWEENFWLGHILKVKYSQEIFPKNCTENLYLKDILPSEFTIDSIEDWCVHFSKNMNTNLLSKLLNTNLSFTTQNFSNKIIIGKHSDLEAMSNNSNFIRTQFSHILYFCENLNSYFVIGNTKKRVIYSREINLHVTSNASYFRESKPIFLLFDDVIKLGDTKIKANIYFKFTNQ